MPRAGWTLAELQARIEAVYGARDRGRGLATSFMWFAEEVGELSRALRRTDDANLREEFADVLAWLVTLASIAGVDIEQAANKYARGCPRCHETPCGCPSSRPPRASKRRAGSTRRRKSKPSKG